MRDLGLFEGLIEDEQGENLCAAKPEDLKGHVKAGNSTNKKDAAKKPAVPQKSAAEKAIEAFLAIPIPREGIQVKYYSDWDFFPGVEEGAPDPTMEDVRIWLVREKRAHELSPETADLQIIKPEKGQDFVDYVNAGRKVKVQG